MKNIKKVLSVILALLICISVFPATGYAASNKTVSLVWGESAKAAGAKIYIAEDPPYDTEEPPEEVTEDSIDISSYRSILVYIFEEYNSSEYSFVGWRLKAIGSGETQYVPVTSKASEALNIGQTSEDRYANVRELPESADEHAYFDDTRTVKSVLFVYGVYIAINSTEYDLYDSYTIEPIFEKIGGSSTSSYEFTLNNKDSKTAVENGEDLVLDMYIDGADYNAFSAVVTYDSSLFEYKSCTPTTVSVDTATEGTLKLSATGLDKVDGDLAATLTFTAKAVNEATAGEFTITEAKATTSEAAVSGDAPAAATGEAVSVTVNPVTTYTVTYPNGTTDTVASGEDVTFTLSEKYDDYEAEGFTYTVTAGDLTVEDNNDGTYTIKSVTNDVTVEVAKNFAGTLTTETLTVGSASYTVAKITGSAPSGKTFFYDGNQMIKSGEAYLYIIGTSGEADSSKITVAAAEGEIVMAAAGDVNQTGKIDINDAQLVSDLYNGKYADFETVSMVKFLAADVNGDGAVDTSDIAAVISNTAFVY